MTLLWSDEFDGPAGTPPDPAWWSHELDSGNHELQSYTADPANAALDGDGNLAITARGEPDGCTSARLITKGKFAFRYGRVEARLKLPRGAGLWPAVWALGADIDEVGWPCCGEIDVMEHVGQEPRRASSARSTAPATRIRHGFGGATELTRGPRGRLPRLRRRVETRQASSGASTAAPTTPRRPPTSPAAGSSTTRSSCWSTSRSAATFGGPVDAELPQALLVDYVRVSAAD